MKKIVVTFCLVAFMSAGLAGPATALPPFSTAWKGKYVEGNADQKFLTAVESAKCNVCHDAASKSKKDKNEYGKAVGKYLSKAEYDKVKADMEAAKKFILEGLAKAEAEKAASGKTYGDLLKAGSLPSGS
ncbi:MAG: hypothetical protein WEH44_03835 [Pirellulaceae bacterium]